MCCSGALSILVKKASLLQDVSFDERKLRRHHQHIDAILIPNVSPSPWWPHTHAKRDAPDKLALLSREVLRETSQSFSTIL